MSNRIPNGTTDQYIYFTAVDATDGFTKETGLTGFTVYRSRDGGTPTLWTTPTIAEVDATNMAGVYSLLIDEDTTIDPANSIEMMRVSISEASMRDVELDIELVRASATEEQVTSLNAATGGAIYFVTEGDNTVTAIEGVSFVGVETSGTYLNTQANDGVYHNISDTANQFDIVYAFDIGQDRTANEVEFKGYLQGGNDTALIQAFNGTGWDTVGTIAGQAGTGNITVTQPLLSIHTGRNGSAGTVYIRIKDDGAGSGPDLFVDSLTVTGVNNGLSVGYANGSIWVDTISGTAGTESFVNGVADNPSLTLADALTLANNVGLKRITFAPRSSVTLAAILSGYTLFNGSIDINGQDISDSTFVGATITGTMGGTGVGSATQFTECVINAVSINSNTTLEACSIGGNITAREAGTFYIHDCWSQIAGGGSITFDYGAALNASDLNIRRHSGGWTIENMGAGTGTYNSTFEGMGQIVFASTCSGGNASIRGTWRITDNSTVSPTITYDDNAEHLNNLNAGVNVAQIGGSATSATNLAASTLGIIRGEFVGTPTATVLDTDLTYTTDDHVFNRVLVITSGNAAGVAAVIASYNGTTKEITVDALPVTPAATDTFVIV